MTIDQFQVRRAIALRLIDCRIKAGYESAEVFCSAHNIPLAQYTSHESGNAQIKASTAIRYWKLLRCSLTYLLLGDRENRD